MRRRRWSWELALAALAALAAAPAGAADKTRAVTVGPWRFFSGAPPAGWTDPAFDDRGWGGPAEGPFGPRHPPLPGTPAPPGPQAAPVGTLYDLASGQPLLLRARFSVADAPQVRVLDLRVAYADGFIAYLNGKEIARRGMAPAGRAAAGPHGPEIERISVPLPSPSLPALSIDGNLLAVAVFASPGRSAVVPSTPAAWVEVGAASGVRIVRGPYLSTPADGPRGAGLRVNWLSDLPASGIVTVERADVKGPPEAPRLFKVGESSTRQAVTVDGLVPGGTYRYRVELDAGGGDRASVGPVTFKTLSAPSQPLRFAVYGDMRYPGHVAHRAIVEALVREAPALIVNTGDLTDVGSEESNWQKYFEITAPLGAIAPVVPALGNHDADRGGAGARLTWDLFGVPAKGPPGWTSLDLGGVHFVILSTNEMRNPAQLDWLRDDLARARRHHVRAIFAFCHEGPWAHGFHGGASQMARAYAPLLAAAHVDVLFSGHDHIYERGIGTTRAGRLTYVVTGGGGAPLYNPRCQSPSGPPPVGVPGPLPACPPSVLVLTNTYHYIMVEVSESGIVTLCPRHPDGSAVEACVQLPPQGGHGSHGSADGSAHGSD
jgi:hypothetical protein